jgi:hypothetical protein
MKTRWGAVVHILFASFGVYLALYSHGKGDLLLCTFGITIAVLNFDIGLSMREVKA